MAVKMKVRISPASQKLLREQVKLLKESHIFPIARGLYKEAEIMMGESKMPHNCPVDTSILRSSGQVELPKIATNRTSCQVRLGYGGAASEYAVHVHENLHAKHHPPYGKGGRAKYLEIPTMQRAGHIGKTVAEEMEKDLRKMALKGKR